MSGEGGAKRAMGSTTREQVGAVIVAFAAGLVVLAAGGADEGTAVDPPPQRESTADSSPERREETAPSPPPQRVAADRGDYTASDRRYRYVVELPEGESWSSPVERFRRRFDLLRTTVRSESGAVLVIDRTPSDTPVLGGEIDSSSAVGHPEFGEMVEYVFHDSTIVPPCFDGTCVDYLVEDGEGGGWGVLVGGTGLGSAQELARRTAETLRLAD